MRQNQEIRKVQEKISYQMRLDSSGFHLSSFDDYYAIFLKPKNNISDKMVFSLFPIDGGVLLSQLNHSIISSQVNAIMSFLDSAFNQLEDTLIDRRGFYDSQKIREDISVLVLNQKEIKEDNILMVGNIFKKYYSKHAIPFFSEIKSLEDINNKVLDKEEWQNWSDYIFGKTYLKAMVILKLVNNEKGYNEFIQMYIPRIEEGIKNGREDLKTYLADVKKLNSYLKRSAYKDLPEK